MNNNLTYIIVGIAALLVLGGGLAIRRKDDGDADFVINEYYVMSAPKGKITRGYRNNNPLNIRISGEPWQGKVKPNTDGSYEQFISMPYGFRAAFALLRTYYNVHGCNTIRKIISRWAPPTENNTEGYINHVAEWSGIPADKTLTFTANNYIPIVYAMARAENGYYPLMSDVKSGWNLL